MGAGLAFDMVLSISGLAKFNIPKYGVVSFYNGPFEKPGPSIQNCVYALDFKRVDNAADRGCFAVLMPVKYKNEGPFLACSKTAVRFVFSFALLWYQSRSPSRTPVLWFRRRMQTARPSS